MTLELINPGDLPTPSTYTQVVVATGSRLVFVAGRWRCSETTSPRTR